MSVRRLLVLWLAITVALFLVVPDAWETVWFLGWLYWRPIGDDGLTYALDAAWWAFLPAAWVIVGAIILIAMGLRRWLKPAAPPPS
jgi:hypothetical protein